jgi:hypothetical protein
MAASGTNIKDAERADYLALGRTTGFLNWYGTSSEMLSIVEN